MNNRVLGNHRAILHINVVEYSNHEFIYLNTQWEPGLYRIKTDISKGVSKGAYGSNGDTNVFVESKVETFHYRWKYVNCDENDPATGCLEEEVGWGYDVWHIA